MDDEKIVKCEISLGKIFFPKFAKRVDGGEFAIFTSEITKRIENCEDLTNTIKLKGNVCTLEYGTTYKVFCKLVDLHETYGNTYEIVYISKCIDISSADKQREFLRNIINENLVDKLFEKYDDVLSLLENKDVKAMMKVKGIGNQVALRIIDEYEESKDYSSIYIELGRLGLTHTLIKKLVDYYGSPDIVVDTVKNKPYQLVSVDGIGFKKADEIACKVGVGQFDIERIKGFIIYHLIEMGEAGKSYVYYQDLMHQLYDTLGFVPEEVITNVAKIMIDNKDVVVLDGGNKIALTKYYNLEKNIMNELLRLAYPVVADDVSDFENEDVDELLNENENKAYTPKPFVITNWTDIIHKVEMQQGYEYTEEQLGAIELSLNSYVMALTGLGGSGKTSTANGICSLFHNYTITACALSGKAAVRITEATGLPASTIHRALGYQNGTFSYNKHNKMPIDILVLDEATMVNGFLFLSLLQACPTGAKVIIMGDVQQLTPIGNCQVFSDILESGMLPVVKLTKPHRQALLSGIIPTSIKVANQELIFNSKFEGNEILGELQDMELDISQTNNNLTDCVISHFQNEMKKHNNILEVQICVPMRLRGDLSCYTLNNKLQDIYNPKFVDTPEIEIVVSQKSKDKDEESKKYVIRKGDKVLNTKNNYKCVTVDGDTCAVFNGNIGIVEDITKDGYCTIDFIGIGQVVFKKAECKNLELAYACTVHKMQGSGFNSTIVAIDNSSYILNNAELLYTAITRAKKYCVLIGNNSAIRAAIQKKEVKTKQTFLKDFLIESSKGVA